VTVPFFLPVFFKSRFADGAPPLTRAEYLDILVALRRLGPELRRVVLRGLPEAAVRALADEWWWQVHGGQEEPAAAPNGAPWRIWAIVAGRGFGKTRAGAEWVWQRAREQGTVAGNCPLRIALVAATFDEVADVMVEGESGLLGLARCDERPRWIPSKRLFLFPSGAQAHAFSAERPEKLRGPQHHFAWCDELAKWSPSGSGQGKADATWNNLMLGLRLGQAPRTIVTTTPKPVPLLRRLLALPRCVATHGRTDENPHLAADFREAMDSMFAGTRLARQELEGLLLDEFEGALWSRELLEKARAPEGDSHFHAPSRTNGYGGAKSDCPHLHRIVIGLDPPASTGGDSCGLVVCGMDSDGIAYVLADLTAHGLSAEAWARRVADAAEQHGASRVVAEKNQGGDMIASVLRAVDADLPIRLVAATKSKAARAEPIALRFETGRAKLAGHFPELEDQLCALTWSGYQGAGSPDRADAMVWAMTELFEKQPGAPNIRRL
jgi:phage terminase large subunit-like protein